MIALITGGASSGKSSAAEELCLALGGPRVYLAAMQPFGEEGRARVQRHREKRAGKGFCTIECYEGLHRVLDDGRLRGCVALLECLGNVAANGLFADGGEATAERARLVRAQVARCVDELARTCAHLVVVGDEVGCDGEPYTRETSVYRQLLGDIACDMAQRSQLVAVSRCGIPIVLKAPGAGECNEETCELIGSWTGTGR